MARPAPSSAPAPSAPLPNPDPDSDATPLNPTAPHVNEDKCVERMANAMHHGKVTDPMRRILVTCRWIPLGIDLYVTASTLLMAGTKEYRRLPTPELEDDENPEEVDIDSDDRFWPREKITKVKVMFRKVCQLHPLLEAVVLECHQDFETFSHLKAKMQERIDQGRADALKNINDKVSRYVSYDIDRLAPHFNNFHKRFKIPERGVPKAERGFAHPLFAAQLCPVSLLSEFFNDPNQFMEECISGEIIVTHEELPALLFYEPKADAVNPETQEGIFRSRVLARMFQCLYHAYMSDEQPITVGRRPLSQKFGMKTIEPNHIAAVAVLCRIAMSDSGQYTGKKQHFKYPGFYKNLMLFLEGWEERPNSLAHDVMTWWRLNVHLPSRTGSTTEHGVPRLRGLPDDRPVRYIDRLRAAQAEEDEKRAYEDEEDEAYGDEALRQYKARRGVGQPNEKNTDARSIPTPQATQEKATNGVEQRHGFDSDGGPSDDETILKPGLGPDDGLEEDELLSEPEPDREVASPLSRKAKGQNQPALFRAPKKKVIRTASDDEDEDENAPPRKRAKGQKS